MPILTALIVLCTLIYTALLWYYQHYWRALQLAEGLSDVQPSVTVVIPARNEQDYIEQCVRSVLIQDYQGELECIVVDDHSEDQTGLKLEETFGHRILLLHLSGTHRSGKKAALQRGIEQASGEIIMTTDADCTVPGSWVRTVVSAFTEGVHFVTGPLVYTDGKTLCERFQCLDVAGLMVITGAGIKSGLHRLANGANLAFRKPSYMAVGGYSAHTHVPSGDDLFLIQAMHRKFPGGVRYLKDAEAIVTTSPEPGWRAFISQRARWASKNKTLPEQSIAWIWRFVWMVHALLLTGLVAGFLYPRWLAVVILCFLVKIFADAGLVFEGLSFAGMRRQMWYYPLTIVISFWYVLVMGYFAVFKRSYTWKGRRVNLSGSVK